MEHGDMYDCIECETLKQETHRATGEETVTHVTVYTCRECGNVAVCERFHGDTASFQYVDFGDSTVTEALAAYDL